MKAGDRFFAYVVLMNDGSGEVVNLYRTRADARESIKDTGQLFKIRRVKVILQES